MSSKPLLAIDIDDTIAGSTESMRLMVNKRLGIELLPEAYRIPAEYWGYYERVWEANGIKGQISWDDFAIEMIADQLHVPLLPSAQFAVTTLAETYNVIFMTARDKTWEPATKKWLTSNLPNNTFEVYFTSSHKDSTAMTKGQLCRHLGAEILIDDNVEHCQSAIAESVTAILFGSYGWQHAAPSEMVRCEDWPSVVEFLSGKR